LNPGDFAQELADEWFGLLAFVEEDISGEHASPSSDLGNR
jgi:hypothetical protein